MDMIGSVLFFGSLLHAVTCLDNGLALTPPMGWLSWERFRCNVDCKHDPLNCLSESLIKRQADCLVSEGYKAVGYEYVSIDDCWPTHQRDTHGRLQPDPSRFPGGMKALSQYIHSKGLKMGIYEDFGTKTCGGYPGSEFSMQTDAQTFADWGIDLLKFDGCYSDYKDAVYGYPAMAIALNNTGRHILYSCEWPFYDWVNHARSNFSAIRDTCNMWRNYADVQDSWSSIKGIIDYFAKNGSQFQPFAGLGGWNDPDMLVIGNFGLSEDQERMQMAMWTIFAAPLIMSTDLCHVRPSSKRLLQNKRLIAINQDKLGIQGKLVFEKDTIQVWARPISPIGSMAIAILNFFSGGGPLYVNFTCKDLGMTNPGGYNITETFDGRFIGEYKPKDVFEGFVNPTGVFMITVHPLK